MEFKLGITYNFKKTVYLPMKYIYLLIVVSFLFSACAKKTHSTRATSPLQTEINNFEKNTTCESAKISEYEFQSQLVYVFDPGKCGADMTSNVTDKQGKSLGQLGGFIGNTQINGKDFSTAKFMKIVWKKTNSEM